MCRCEETSAHILYECEALASLRHVHFFFLEPKDIKSINLGGPFVTLAKLQGSHDLAWGAKGLIKRPRCIGNREGSRTQVQPFNQSTIILSSFVPSC